MKKRIKNLMKGLVVCAVAIALTALPTKVTKAEEIKLTRLKNPNDVFNTNPVLDIEWCPVEELSDKGVNYGTFTVDEPVVLVYRMNIIADYSFKATGWSPSYAQMEVFVDNEYDNYIWVNKYDKSKTEQLMFVFVNKGKHSIKVSGIKDNVQCYVGYVKGNIQIGYLKLSDILDISESKASNGNITLTVKSKIDNCTPKELMCTKGKITFNKLNSDKVWNKKSKEVKSAKCNKSGIAKIKVNSTGWYTFNFKLAGERIQINYKVTGKDTEKPVVTGVSNNETYTTPVKIKFSDKGSGIKSAKLNGKAIKSGKTIKKSGNYKLVVIDKSGNKTTVKFKVKL